MQKEVYLTTWELVHTYGFIKIMSLIWTVPVLIIVGILIYRRKKII